jgi:hypothetical protein
MSDKQYLMPIEDKIQILKLAVEASKNEFVVTKLPLEHYNEMIAALLVDVLVS